MSHNLSSGATVDVDGTGYRVALVCARFNDLIVNRLRDGAIDALNAHGVASTDITTIWIPGALEAPQAVRAACDSGRFDAVIALGTVIRGDTYHFEIVAETSALGIDRVATSSPVAVTNGILTVDTAEQADVRSADLRQLGADTEAARDDVGDSADTADVDMTTDAPALTNKGAEAALAALDLAATLAALRAP